MMAGSSGPSEAFKRLFPRPLVTGDQTAIAHGSYLLDAIYLYQSKSLLPFSLYIGDEAESTFLKGRTPQAVEA